MKVKVFDRQGRLVGPVEVAQVVKTDAEWDGQLTPAQFQVARGKGTERAFCGTLLDNKRQGVYACVCCGLPLFASGGKFNSGTGWPSFFQPVRRRTSPRRDAATAWPHRDPLRPLRLPTSATSSRTARPRPAFAIASTPSRSPSPTRGTSPRLADPAADAAPG